MRSVLAYLETENFCRVKLGIGRPPHDEDSASYVLSPFSLNECEQVDALISRAVDVLECVIGEGISVAMNRFHAPPASKDSTNQLD